MSYIGAGSSNVVWQGKKKYNSCYWASQAQVWLIYAMTGTTKNLCYSCQRAALSDVGGVVVVPPAVQPPVAIADNNAHENNDVVGAVINANNNAENDGDGVIFESMIIFATSYFHTTSRSTATKGNFKRVGDR